MYLVRRCNLRSHFVHPPPPHSRVKVQEHPHFEGWKQAGDDASRLEVLAAPTNELLSRDIIFTSLFSVSVRTYLLIATTKQQNTLDGATYPKLEQVRI